MYMPRLSAFFVGRILLAMNSNNDFHIRRIFLGISDRSNCFDFCQLLRVKSFTSIT